MKSRGDSARAETWCARDGTLNLTSFGAEFGVAACNCGAAELALLFGACALLGCPFGCGKTAGLGAGSGAVTNLGVGTLALGAGTGALCRGPPLTSGTLASDLAGAFAGFSALESTGKFLRSQLGTLSDSYGCSDLLRGSPGCRGAAAFGTGALKV